MFKMIVGAFFNKEKVLVTGRPFSGYSVTSWSSVSICIVLLCQAVTDVVGCWVL